MKAEKHTQTVYILDDHELVVRGFASMLSGIPGLRSIGGATNTDDAERDLARMDPNYFVVDLDLSSSSGLDFLINTRASLPHICFIIYSGYTEKYLVELSAILGAKAYVSKAESPMYLIDSMRSKERFYISPALRDRMGDLTLSRSKTLTPKQSDIVGLVARGKGNKQISERLKISVRTVENHKAIIQKKLSLRSSADLHRFATSSLRILPRI